MRCIIRHIPCAAVRSYEKKHVDILRHAHLRIHQTKIEGNAACEHITLQNIITGEWRIERFEILFRFGQGERFKVKPACDTVMQTALIVYQLVCHPRGRGTGCNQYNVISAVCPSVPKIFKGTDKSGALGVNPRHFINEDDFFRFTGSVSR